VRRKMQIVDPRTGRRMTVYVQPVSKPPAVVRRRRRRPPVVYEQPDYPEPVYQPNFVHPHYERERRHSKAVTWAVGVILFFGSFVACEISPVLTIAGWGLPEQAAPEDQQT
jgi:hypothetical protein